MISGVVFKRLFILLFILMVLAVSYTTYKVVFYIRCDRELQYMDNEELITGLDRIHGFCGGTLTVQERYLRCENRNGIYEIRCPTDDCQLRVLEDNATVVERPVNMTEQAKENLKKALLNLDRE